MRRQDDYRIALSEDEEEGEAEQDEEMAVPASPATRSLMRDSFYLKKTGAVVLESDAKIKKDRDKKVRD